MTVLAPWLVLIHQIPPKPDYLRVKIGRRLQRLGAVPIKKTVYVLPNRPQSLEDFQWVRAEVNEGGGDASICTADFVDGLTSEQIIAQFREARDADYAELAVAAREARAGLRRRDRDADRRSVRPEDDLARLKRRFAAIAAIDFFHAPGRPMAEEAIRALSDALKTAPPPHLGDPRRNLCRPDRQRVADPAVHRPRRSLQVRRCGHVSRGGGGASLRHVSRRVHPRRRSVHVRDAARPLWHRRSSAACDRRDRARHRSQR